MMPSGDIPKAHNHRSSVQLRKDQEEMQAQKEAELQKRARADFELVASSWRLVATGAMLTP